MSTRSRIGIENKDGTVESIYCHNDGYPSYNGRVLRDYYQDEKKIRDLIALGSISSLDEEIGQKHSFNCPVDGWVVAYGRDRGETGVGKRVNESRGAYLDKEDWDIDYHYLFSNDGEWLVSKEGKRFYRLTDNMINRD